MALNSENRPFFRKSTLVVEPTLLQEVKEYEKMNTLKALRHFNVFESARRTVENGGIVSSPDAAIYSEWVSTAAFLHLICNPESSPDIAFRTKVATRQISYFTATGKLDPHLFEQDTLFLGWGLGVLDVFPIKVDHQLIDPIGLRNAILSPQFHHALEYVDDGNLPYRLRKGKIIGVEWDEAQMGIAKQFMKDYKMNHEAHTLSLEEYFETFPRRTYPLITGFRTDPRLLGFSEEERKITARTIVEHIDPYGQGLFTIGQGNMSDDKDLTEFYERTSTLDLLRSAAEEVGFQTEIQENEALDETILWTHGSIMDIRCLIIGPKKS